MSISGTVNRVKEENSRESLELQKHSVALGEKNVETLVELNTQMSGLIKATEDMAKKSAFSEKNSKQWVTYINEKQENPVLSVGSVMI